MTMTGLLRGHTALARGHAAIADGHTAIAPGHTTAELRVRLVVGLLALALLLPRAADAQPDFDGAAQLHYELQGFHDYHHDAMDVPAARDLVMAGARLHGFIGGKWLGYHAGIDLAAGGTINHGGFAYDVALFPAGVALRFAETSFLTLGFGIGANGATGTMDDAATLPVELRFEVGRGIRLLGRARATYVLAADNRQQGSMSTDRADELEAMLALRLGRAYTDWGFPTGNGYFFGVTYREALGARFAGAVIGYSIDMGSPRMPLHRQSSSCEDCE